MWMVFYEFNFQAVQRWTMRAILLAQQRLVINSKQAVGDNKHDELEIFEENSGPLHLTKA